jgi:ATP adenylyltransferase
MPEILYSPWRMRYILSEKETRCIFCFADDSADREHLVLHRSASSFVIMNMYPYNNGHLMVVPVRHVPRLNDLTPEECDDLFRTVRLTEKVLTECYHPGGMNIGMNLGRAAGAGVEEHLHVHLTPRWDGDCNFMTAIGGVRVIPEDFETAYPRLKELFDKAAASEKLVQQSPGKPGKL